jgi:hypothetical protein
MVGADGIGSSSSILGKLLGSYTNGVSNSNSSSSSSSSSSSNATSGYSFLPTQDLSTLTIGGKKVSLDSLNTKPMSAGTGSFSIGGGFGGSFGGGGTSISKSPGTTSDSSIQSAAQTNTSSTTEQNNNRISVTLYINPNRINMSTQKVISKAITRGGIFYNHWGDDNWQMALAGSCGLAGMKYIQKLEQIYQMSGVLLAYGENSQGAVYTGCENNLYNSIVNGDYAGAVGAIMDGNTTGLWKTLSKGTGAALASAITGKGSTALRSSAVFSKLAVVMGAGVEKINTVLAKCGTLSVGNKDSSNSVLGKLGGSFLGKIIANKLGLSDGDSTGANAANVIDFDTASTGWADIADELEDPWRPRQVWIYFEDRVYIGHFNSFSYQRVAQFS